MWIRTLPMAMLSIALAGCHTARSEYVPALQPSQVADFAETFRIRYGGDSAGSMTLEVHVTRDSLISTIRGFYDGSLVQHVVVTFDPHSLRLREVRDSVPSRIEVLTYAADRLRGMVVVQNLRDTRDTFHVNMPIDSLTFDRRSLLSVTPWVPLETGRMYSLRMFDPDTRTVYPARIAIGPKAAIAGPNGRVEAYRVELTTRPPKWFAPMSYVFPTVLWIRADSSRRILRIERPRIDAVYELTVESPPRP